jgi:hypothetical protein
LILVGGLVPGAFPRGPFEDAWEFRLDELRWQPIGLPEVRPRWWQPAAAYDLHRRRLLLSEYDWIWSLDLRTRGPRPRPEETSRAATEPSPERASASGLVLSVLGSGSFRERIEAEVSLPDGSPARLELFDVLGRRVRSQALAPVQVERRRVEMGTWPGFPSGVYLMQLTQAGRCRVVRLVHAR